MFFLKQDGFEPTPSEAVFLRQVIRDCLIEKEEIKKYEKETGKASLNRLILIPEIIWRFFFQYYGVDQNSYLKIIKEDQQDDAIRDLYKYIQEKLRKDKELI